jgi:hypothetical protein
MNRFLKLAFVLGIGGSLAFCAKEVRSAKPAHPFAHAAQPAKVLREYKGVKLGLKREQVLAALGTPESSNATSDDFKLTGEDTMTVHYDNEAVKAIQLAFYDPKNAPNWKDVVGDAETTELATGAKTARKEIPQEKFWVSIYQNKDGTVIRITISRN